MYGLTDPEFWARLVGIVVIDLTLAGDNALVIALAVRTLPSRERFWGRVWGTAGAVLLRLAFIAVATVFLEIPLVQMAGGLLLVWVALKLVRQAPSHGGHDGAVRHGSSLREAVWIIVVADAAMSLDNVLAVAATAHGDLVLVAAGIGLSIPLVVWGSGLLARLMNRVPAVVWIGGGILGYVAAEMVLHDPTVHGRLGAAAGAAPAVSVAFAAVVAGLGWYVARRSRAPMPVATGRTTAVREAAGPRSARSTP